MNIFGFQRRLATLSACLLAFLFAVSASVSSTEKPPPLQNDKAELAINMDHIMQPQKGDLPDMINRRAIRVLTTYSKTFFFIDKGTQRGATHDLFIALEKDLNNQLAKEKKLKQKHLKVRIVFIPVTRDNLFKALNEGKGDIAAANLTITSSRQEQVAFTTPLYSDVKELLVSGPSSSDVKNLEQLSGKTVFVRRSSSYYESLQTLNARFAKASLPPVILQEAPEALEDEDLLEMLNAGLIPLIVVDRHKALFWKQVFPKIQVHDDIVLRDGGSIAWAVRKDNPQLLAVLNNFVKNNRQGSTLGNMILLRYLKSATYVKNAAANRERAKFLQMVEIFRKYGERYDVDWLLMAAQGYQESRLNQSVRSHVGAIGVMQVMPATGKELKVGDIKKIDPNIHAGVKYMRWMIDHYYGDQPMTPLDKALFSFASYNAGPARIARLRTETQKRGFDPNIWFGNVENLAAEKIGAETVTYVSNIYKYYIAYRLIMDDIARKQKATAAPLPEPGTGKPQPDTVPPTAPEASAPAT
ncbi:TPA: transporter substrate-binding domain-containing protein [Klebsiella aerogenes]|uniref:transglycosylase SLT domain-containing protein n=1 Tax=Klebsiella aerogenes TaxID=548 RepID=UPI00063C690B|nr:lytic transglycosylase F [Klebsiella aerogenes]EKZ5445883.1 lytic transglycosylase F [Klebsiella aerogenes]EMB4653465.1 lytic transglycosylase F [Klebsiella aerogenes]KLE94773.1 lytic transglycosylase [Klebsiella aerogenes]HBV4841176.1 lytic transglycosylase F [Klebsiella aerogenes]HDH0704504.1 lytic transglycosylase F [Klebsiella aerogenes]